MKKLAGLIQNVAPVLGSMLGPGGTAAGAVVSKIAQVLGAPEDDEEALSQALLNASPDQIAEIKRIDAEHKERMAELGLRPDELMVEDRQDARDMAKEEGQTPQLVFTAMLTVLIGCVTYAVFQVEMPEDNRLVAGTFLGILAREWAGAMHFWFGTSIGSQKKDAERMMGRLKA